MRIRKLELNGFKSFPDRTLVEFGPGISAVVGPNGSGKSNLLDAMRWVIGEQSARSLRGDEMLDVIFAGSSDRPAVSYAEVVLTLAADDGEPFPGEYARFTELQVGRRLHRSGASEYFVNQIRCRRRDVTDLFLDTGVATDLYCFVEQGSIGRIVHATPGERRVLIEEAAGISRYKVRREEARARLVETATQLDRAADVAEEMGRRLRHLEEQVARVAKFRRLRATVRQQEILLALARYADLAAERRRLRTAHRDALRRAEEADRQARRQQGEADARRDEATVVEAAADRWRDEVAEQDARIRELEGALAFGARRAEEIGRARDVARTEARSLDERIEAAGVERAAAEQERIGLERATAELTRTVAEHTDALAGLRAEAEAARARSEVAERQAMVAASRREGLRMRRDDLARAEAAAGVERDRIEREAAERAADRMRAEDALVLARSVAVPPEVPAPPRRLEDLATRHASERSARAAEAAEALRRATEAAEATVRERTGALSEARWAAWSARDALRTRLAAADEEAGRIVRERLAAEGRLAGLAARDRPEAATLADRPTLVAHRHASGLDADALAALGDRALLPVVSDEAGILALSGERIRLAWDVRPVADGEILPGTRLVDDLADALDWHRRTGGAAAVRGTGEHVGSDGVVALGTGDEARTAAARREEAVRLEAAVAVLGDESSRLDRARTALSEDLAEASRRAEAAEDAWRDGEGLARAEAAETLARVRAEADARETAAGAAAEAERDTLRREHDEAVAAARARDVLAAGVRGEVAAAEARLGAATAAEQALQGALRRLDAERDMRSAEIAAVDPAPADGPTDLDALRAMRRSAEEREQLRREAHAGAVVQQATVAERLAARRAALADSDRRRGDLEAASRALAARRAELDAARAANDDAASRAGADLEVARTARGAAWERLLRDRERSARYREALRVLDEEVRGHAAARDAAAREAGDLDVHAREAQVEIEGLRKRMEERYLAVLPALLDQLETHGKVVVETDDAARADITIAGRTFPGVPDLDIRPSHLQDYDGIAALVEQIEEGRRQVAALGEVNLAAVDEYDDVRRRHGDLVAQRTDLEQACERLRDAIAKMNRTSRERFRETFDRVTDNLERLYPRLVGGGRAHLALTDEEDLLETGVDIFVQPPGKRLQNLSLLSGGEKAMTAIAVLLALFQVKPSPFCVLDEVDAPLDEVNAGRFNEMLREMAGLAQFILITHNRKTMEAADTLYGITMPTPGVSRLVSVRLTA